MPFHVVINNLRNQGWPVVNLTEDEVNERFVGPWLYGTAVVARGRHFNAGEYWLTVYEGPERHQLPDDIKLAVDLKFKAVEVTDQFVKKPFGAERPASVDAQPVEQFAEDRRSVMVVHGRDSGMRKSMFEFLRAVDLRPLEWTELVSSVSAGAPYVGEVLDSAFAKAQAVVVLMTPDDLARLRPELLPEGDPDREGLLQAQPRPNVFLEAGMAIGRFPTRTILAEAGPMRPASDLAGRHTIRLDSGPEWRRDLAQRLENAGCLVKTDGTDWLTAGAFEVPIPPVGTPSEQQPIVTDDDSGLLRRVDALRAELVDVKGYVTMGIAGVYNALLDEAGAEDIPRALPTLGPGSVSGRTPRSQMVAQDMRVHLGQLRERVR